jgi:hypothetical protein
MSSNTFQDSELGKLVRGLIVVASAALMILPAYFNYYLGPTKIGFEAVTAMGITLMCFAIGIILFIMAVGPEKFKPKAQAQ